MARCVCFLRPSHHHQRAECTEHFARGRASQRTRAVCASLHRYFPQHGPVAIRSSRPCRGYHVARCNGLCMAQLEPLVATCDRQVRLNAEYWSERTSEGGGAAVCRHLVGVAVHDVGARLGALASPWTGRAAGGRLQAILEQVRCARGRCDRQATGSPLSSRAELLRFCCQARSEPTYQQVETTWYNRLYATTHLPLAATLMDALCGRRPAVFTWWLCRSSWRRCRSTSIT